MPGMVQRSASPRLPCVPSRDEASPQRYVGFRHEAQGAARSKVLGWPSAGPRSGVMRPGDASSGHFVGNKIQSPMSAGG